MKALVVYKKSAYELYKEHGDANMQEFLLRDSTDVELMKRSHDEQKESLEAVFRALEEQHIDFDDIYRGRLENFDPMSEYEIVFAVGGDGTFLEVSHYIRSEIPLVGINSDPKRSIGYYCCCNGLGFAKTLRELHKLPQHRLSRLDIMIDSKIIVEMALNDILIAHNNPAATTRYRIISENEQKEYRNSGLLVCTAAGSTAWMYEEGGEIMPLNSNQMQYRTRGKRNEVSHFVDELRIHSMTREGRVYIDGEHLNYPFGLGADLSIVKGFPLTIICDLEKKRAKYRQ